MRFAIFPLTCVKYCVCHEKLMPGHTKCCTCHAKSSQQTWRSDTPKCSPLSGNERPDLRTSLMNMSFVREMHLWKSSSNAPRLPSFLEMLQNPHVFLTFDQVHNPLRLPRKTTSEPPKVARTCGALYIFISKCASRHNGVHFFDVSTSKSGPRLRCFVHFDFEMCFAPQRRALFRHLNFQKCSEAEVLCTFWLRKVLRATTACTFSTVVWRWGVLYILTSTCASCHNGVQFFISHLASWLRTRRFSEPTFRPSIATNHWKNTVFRNFPTFSRICIFFLLTLSLLLFSLLIFLFSLPLPCSAFHLSILSEVWLLNFLRSYPILYVYCCALHEWSWCRISSFLSKLCQLGRLVSQWLIFWRCWGNGRERAMWSPGVNPLGAQA